MSDPVRDPRFVENEVALWADTLIHGLVENLAGQMTCDRHHDIYLTLHEEVTP